MLINTASDIIASCNNDIELVADCYIKAVFLNRFLVICIVGLCIFLIVKNRSNKLNLGRIDEIKFKQICEWEDRSTKDEVRHIIKQYIDHFTRVHNVKWENDN